MKRPIFHLATVCGLLLSHFAFAASKTQIAQEKAAEREMSLMFHPRNIDKTLDWLNSDGAKGEAWSPAHQTSELFKKHLAEWKACISNYDELEPYLFAGVRDEKWQTSVRLILDAMRAKLSADNPFQIHADLVERGSSRIMKMDLQNLSLKVFDRFERVRAAYHPQTRVVDQLFFVQVIATAAELTGLNEDQHRRLDDFFRFWAASTNRWTSSVAYHNWSRYYVSSSRKDLDKAFTYRKEVAVLAAKDGSSVVDSVVFQEGIVQTAYYDFLRQGRKDLALALVNHVQVKENTIERPHIKKLLQEIRSEPGK